MADIYIEIDYSLYDRINRKVLDLLIDKPVEKPIKEPVKKKFSETGLKNTHLRVVV